MGICLVPQPRADRIDPSSRGSLGGCWRSPRCGVLQDHRVGGQGQEKLPTKHRSDGETRPAFFGVNNRGVSLWKKPTCPTQSRQGIIIQTKTVWATPLWCANLNGQNTYALFLRNNPPKPDTPIPLRRRRQFPRPQAYAREPEEPAKTNGNQHRNRRRPNRNGGGLSRHLRVELNQLQVPRRC